jgi:hypothetical protein
LTLELKSEVSCFTQEQVVRMGITPALFLASGKKASGEPAMT